MFGTRMTDEQVTTLVTELRKRGLCRSKHPHQALLEATDRRITCHKARRSKIARILHGSWIVETNTDAMKTAQESDLPVICLIHRIAPGVTKGTTVHQHLRSNDGLLDVEYNITPRGKATKVGVTPYDESAVVEAIINQPVEVLVTLMGIHPQLDAYIAHQLAQTPEETP